MLRELNTAEQLNNLPFGAVILDGEDGVWKALRTGWKGQWLWVSIYGTELMSEDLVRHGELLAPENAKSLFSLVSCSEGKLSNTKAVGVMKTYSLEELEALPEGSLFGAHETIPGDIIITTVWRCDGDGTASLISHESDTSENLSYFAATEAEGSGFYLTVLQKPDSLIVESVPDVVLSSHGVAKKLYKEFAAEGAEVSFSQVIRCVEAGMVALREGMIRQLSEEE